MNTLKVIGVIFLVGAALVVLFVVGVFGKGCSTAEKMADETIFNADKHVWSYEEFHRSYNQYLQYEEQATTAQSKLDTLQAHGIITGQRYDNLANEVDGARNMMHRIAANYNAMSEIFYQSMWKSKGLPEKLEPDK